MRHSGKTALMLDILYANRLSHRIAVLASDKTPSMTSFTDGPAAGQHLSLRRAPWFLRVVESRDGKFDALDQLHDKPEPTEAIYVYALSEKAGMRHVRKTGGGGFYALAKYHCVATQPDDIILRDAVRWEQWVNEMAKTYPKPTGW